VLFGESTVLCGVVTRTWAGTLVVIVVIRIFVVLFEPIADRNSFSMFFGINGLNIAPLSRNTRILDGTVYLCVEIIITRAYQWLGADKVRDAMPN